MTKKALVAVRDGELRAGAPFVLPVFGALRGFLVEKTGAPCAVAAVVYTGRTVTPDTLWTRYAAVPGAQDMDEAIYRAAAEAYLSELARHKVGAFVRVDPRGDVFRLLAVPKAR